MPKAVWNGTVIAQSDDCEMVEGNCYFPAASVDRRYLRDSETHTTCPWKGVASYYDVVIGEHVNKDAAWYYPTPKEAAQHVTGRIAFWKGVQVEN